MLIIELLAMLMSIGVIAFGLYFLKFKKEKNSYGFILGYLYSLFGIIGLILTVIVMI